MNYNERSLRRHCTDGNLIVGTISSRAHWHPGFSCIPSRDMMRQGQPHQCAAFCNACGLTVLQFGSIIQHDQYLKLRYRPSGDPNWQWSVPIFNRTVYFHD